MDDFRFHKAHRNRLTFVLPEAKEDVELYEQVAQEFLENLLKGVAKRCGVFHNATYDFHDMPYTYNERGMDAVILPTISELCDGLVMTEVPVSRERNRSGSEVQTGAARLDYWCIYKGFSFAIELKHSFDCFTTETVRKTKIVDRWAFMTKMQLGALGKHIVGAWGDKTEGVIRLGLHFVTSYSDKSPNDKLIAEARKGVEDRLNTIAKAMNGDATMETRPDFAGAWLIGDEIVKGDESATYPALMLFGKVMKPLKLRN